MSSITQHGYLLLADITGYTSYLAGVELDHAHEILTDLLETIVGRLKSVLTVAKLEGDAVFAYVPETRLTRGETLLELIESTYTAFRDRATSMHRATTCTCRACKSIPVLDLKFLAHHGDFIVQNVSGIRELVGTDVNLIHRLLKNQVGQATGWRAYALFTERSLEHLNLRPEGGHGQRETYEHLGDVSTLSFDLRQRYEQLVATRRVVVEPDQACITSQHHYPVPPAVVWEWLNDPTKRVQYTLRSGQIFKDIVSPGGRRGVGAKTHCVHGKDVAMEETVLDWKPFQYATVEQVFMGFAMRMTVHLDSVEDGAATNMRVYIDGTSPAPGPLSRPFFKWFLTTMFPVAKLFTNMGRCIEEAETRWQAVDATAAASV